MKTLLAILLILLPIRAGFSQEYLLPEVVAYSKVGIVQPYFGHYCDEMFAELNYVGIDSSSQHIIVWDLGRPYKEIETGGIFIGANSDPMVEVTVATSYVDYGNWWVVGNLTGKDGPSTYAYPFKTYSVRGARYIAVIRNFTQRNGEPNEYGQARIDCVRVLLAKSSVEESLTEVQPEQWFNLLGQLQFYGTEDALRETGLQGVFISRTTKILIP